MMFLLIIMIMYFSVDLGITSMLILVELMSSLKMKCPSYLSKLWKITNF